MPRHGALAWCSRGWRPLPPEGTRAGGPVNWLASALGEAEGLLVLDNAEDLPAEVAHLATWLAGALPGMRVLITSRIPLPGLERGAVPIGSLRVPAGGDTPDQARRSPAVEAYFQWSARARSGVRLPDDQLPAVAEICRAVNGIPLAIRMAAFLCRRHTPGQVLAGIGSSPLQFAPDDRFVPHRHRFLDPVVGWTVERLPAPARRLLPLLAACTGSAMQSDLEPITGESLPASALQDLADAALVSVTVTEAGACYSVPTALRDAVLRLVPGPEADLARRRYRLWCLRQASPAPNLPGIGAGDIVAAVQWATREEPAEALDCITRLVHSLSRSDWGLAALRSVQALAESAHQLGDRVTAAHAVNLTALAEMSGEFQLAQRLLALAETRAARAGNRFLTGIAMANHGLLLARFGEADAARVRVDQGLVLLCDSAAPAQLRQAFAGLAGICIIQGDAAAARAALARCDELAEADDDRYARADQLHNQAELARLEGDHAEAEHLFLRCLDLRMALDASRDLPTTLVGLASLAIERRQHFRAQVLSAAAQGLGHALQAGFSVLEHAELATCRRLALAWVGADAVDAAQSMGSGFAPADAVEYARASSGDPPTSHGPGAHHPLSSAELALVAYAVRFGAASPTQAAEGLYITVGTVKTHWRNIKRRLGFADRDQVLEYARSVGWVEAPPGE